MDSGVLGVLSGGGAAYHSRLHRCALPNRSVEVNMVIVVNHELSEAYIWARLNEIVDMIRGERDAAPGWRSRGDVCPVMDERRVRYTGLQH